MLRDACAWRERTRAVKSADAGVVRMRMRSDCFLPVDGPAAVSSSVSERYGFCIGAFRIVGAFFGRPLLRLTPRVAGGGMRMADGDGGDVGVGGGVMDGGSAGVF